MDCTYQTNRYGMPLLNIVGVTCTNTTFNAAFAFISNELHESYEWALENFKKIVEPEAICTNREMALIDSIRTDFPQKRMFCVHGILTRIFYIIRILLIENINTINLLLENINNLKKNPK